MSRTIAIVASAVAMLAAAGCSPGGSGPAEAVPRLTLRLGFVPDVTQTTVLVGLREGILTRNLGPNVVLRAIPFRSGEAEAAALAAGNLDAAYASTDAILSTISAKGVDFLWIISGATSGGTELVVKPGIGSPAALKGRTLAVPSADGAQGIALRYWLSRQHLAGSSPVRVTSSGSAAAAVQDFASGRADGAWVPAPYDTQMVSAGGHVLESEASSWPSGQFATTNLVVTRAFLTAHTGVVISLLRSQVQANSMLGGNPLQVINAAIAEVKAATGDTVTSSAFASSFAILRFTNDPISSTLPTIARRATATGLPAPNGNLAALYDLAPLNLALRMEGGRPLA